MIQQVVTIPDKDLALFLELAKKFKWKVENEKSDTINDDFVLTPEHIAILEESSKTPSHLCISAEESLKRLNEI